MLGLLIIRTQQTQQKEERENLHYLIIFIAAQLRFVLLSLLTTSFRLKVNMLSLGDEKTLL
jgi:hypothetical protein